MADIKPFPGIRYNPALIPDLSKVITQPYDKVTTKLQAEYYQRHQFNFIRLILPKESDPYASSARSCHSWFAQGILKRDPEPAVYLLEEKFQVAGRTLTRKGFIAAIRVEEFEKGVVLPHEFTLSKPKADRLNLLRATRQDYEQIFMLYPDPNHELDQVLEASGRPLMEARDDYQVLHRVWVLTDKAKLARLREFLADRKLLIADGHHRYETALTYRYEKEKEQPVPPDAALRFKTAAFFNISDPGLVILPTHRLLTNLADFNLGMLMDRLLEFFTVTPVPDEKARAELESAGKGEKSNAYILYAGKYRSFLVQLRKQDAILRFFPQGRSPEYRALDVAVLHSVIIEGLLGISREQIEGYVRYERDWDETVRRVDSGEAQLAFLMNPTRVEQVQALAEKGERMPQKSTDFYPKLVSGLVFMDVSDNERL
ncbi:MAG: DUF1015 domain-containing protein [candidate division WOR-3 bacterium]